MILITDLTLAFTQNFCITPFTRYIVSNLSNIRKSRNFKE